MKQKLKQMQTDRARLNEAKALKRPQQKKQEVPDN